MADFIVLMTVFLAAGAVVLAVLEAVVFLTTDVELPLLDSLVVLAFRLPRVDAAVGGRDGTAACRARTDALPLAELVIDEVVGFLVIAGRDAFTLSAILDMILEEGLGGGPFIGEAGLLTSVFMGDAAGRARGTIRVFEDVGDRTCPGWIVAGSLPGMPRGLFLGFWTSSPWFSLSRPSISSLDSVS